ncbi:hypothetical protein HSB1_23930 [Halogranum salarium B-1]|uniref:Uncharacterized protein n=1 Tax=Halogranum salarium B-1 TaxID=1210908 RepID=J3EW09_9EURY|nr:hypothetical protein HSB1_23930 [Halogranum salarium B-1]
MPEKLRRIGLKLLFHPTRVSPSQTVTSGRGDETSTRRV